MKERILVVEGSGIPERRTSCGALLDGQRYVVEIAGDGADAFARISTRQPELVILDARVSTTTSIEWCRRIKADSLTRDVKVIIVTSTGEWGRVFEAFAAGCDDYVVEPFDRMELELKVREVLKFSHLKSGISRAGAVARI
jgi:two-component system, OmpR family, phosphate regulon response regulator PhoB